MAVLDLYSGGGYYTELLSYVVGTEGVVVSHNNTPYVSFTRQTTDRRSTDDVLENVIGLTPKNTEQELAAGRFDAVLMMLAYRDVYFVDQASGWERVNGDELLAVVYRSMKPGAVLGVIDHAMTTGAPTEAGGVVMRIDPGVVRAELGAAGFIFEGESDILAKKTRDRATDEAGSVIRSRSDRVVMRFRKPWQSKVADPG